MKIIVPISGGKDSTACLLLAIGEVGVKNVFPVFNDTGWEHEITYDYLNYLEHRLHIKIYKTIGKTRRDGSPAATLEELILAQKKFPFGLGRFCTTHLKQYALKDWYENNLFDGKTQYQVWYGMRTDESGQRAKKYAGIESTDLFDMGDLFPRRYSIKLRNTLTVRLPIVDLPTSQVFKILEYLQVKKNPLYDEGTNDRVGCYPCLLAGKKVQKKMFATSFGQKQLAKIKILEEKIGQKYEMFDTDQGSCEACNI